MPRASRLELMHDHVKVIYRTVTGGELPLTAPAGEAPSLAEVERHFAELEAVARALPAVAERVAPFSFRPPFDLIGTERELVIEIGVPGIERNEVAVELESHTVSIVGSRAPQRRIDGQLYLHAEIPRGPFHREVRLPEPTVGPPRLEVENGIIRIRLTRAGRSPRPTA